MHSAVISDVHSNLEALNAVLRDIRKRKISSILFLGDAVGYGPNPNECINKLKKICKVFLAGNHDSAVTGHTPTDNFNENARKAIEWTRNKITDENIKFLKKLKILKIMKRDNLFLAHATPKDPEAWNYMMTFGDAETNFHYFDQKVCLIGHSHTPFIVEKTPSGELLHYRELADLPGTGRYIINVGSVGQPRDRNPMASYAVLTKKEAEIVRIPYDIEKTQSKMKKAGLPEFLIERLGKGI